MLLMGNYRILKEIDVEENGMEKIRFRSFEEFALLERPRRASPELQATVLRYQTEEDGKSAIKSSGNHMVARVELKRLQRVCNVFGINLNLFKSSQTGKYMLTDDVTRLFSWLLDWFDEEHASLLRKKKISSIPEEDLIELRWQIYNALRSIDTGLDAIKEQLTQYEKKSGCPPKAFAYRRSELTLEAIHVLRKEYIVSEAEWEIFADMLEHEYRKSFKPEFLIKSKLSFQEFLAIKEELLELTNRRTKEK